MTASMAMHFDIEHSVGSVVRGLQKALFSARKFKDTRKLYYL
jgi:hypothetical protein